MRVSGVYEGVPNIRGPFKGVCGGYLGNVWSLGFPQIRGPFKGVCGGGFPKLGVPLKGLRGAI